jgi:hypothetical protein
MKCRRQRCLRQRCLRQRCLRQRCLRHAQASAPRVVVARSNCRKPANVVQRADPTLHRGVGGGCKMRSLKLQIKCAVEPLLEVLESNTAEHTFQQRSPTTLPVWLHDARASRFSPSKVQYRIILACYRPRNINPATGARKCSVLGGVGYQFVQGHGKILGIMRADGDWSFLLSLKGAIQLFALQARSSAHVQTIASSCPTQAWWTEG